MSPIPSRIVDNYYSFSLSFPIILIERCFSCCTTVLVKAQELGVVIYIVTKSSLVGGSRPNISLGLGLQIASRKVKTTGLRDLMISIQHQKVQNAGPSTNNFGSHGMDCPLS
mgnify:CR=1 FL=1